MCLMRDQSLEQAIDGDESYRHTWVAQVGFVARGLVGTILYCGHPNLLITCVIRISKGQQENRWTWNVSTVSDGLYVGQQDATAHRIDHCFMT